RGGQGMRGRSALLDSTDMQDGVFQVRLLPAKILQLCGSQPVPEGQQNHGCVTMAPAVVLGRLDQPLDLSLGSGARATDRRSWACAPAKQLRIFRRLDGSL